MAPTANVQVRFIHEDEAGTLWMGTLSQGLIRYGDGAYTQYLKMDGMPDDGVWMIFEVADEDDSGDSALWMCSDVGIYSVSKQELEAFAQGTVASVSPRTFGTADGMRTPECNGQRQPSGTSTIGGELWFPTRDGAVRVAPRMPSPNPYVPPVVVQRVLVDDSLVAFGEGLELKPGGHNVEIRFAGLSFVDPAAVQYRYMMENYDDDWIEGGTSRIARYTNLPPGQYQFRVLASNNDGVWNEQGATLSVVQVPFVYQTAWFRSVLLLLATVALYGGYLWRVRVLRASVLRRTVSERAERQAKEYFLSIYENAAVGIFLGTNDGRFQDANPALVQMLGYASAEDLIAVPPHTIYPEAAGHGHLIGASSVGGAFKDVEVDWACRDGKMITVRLNGRAIERDGARVFVTIAEDITGEKALEEQLRHTQKMEAVGRLAGGVAHDFNNLLTVITGHAEMWLADQADGDHVLNARAILSASQRATSLTKQLLTFSRRNVTRPRVLQVNDVIDNLEPMLARLIGERIGIVKELGAALPPVRVDPGEFEQVLVNLVLNARDAMPSGGNITLITTERSIAPGNAWGLPPGSYVVTSVSDAGVGMDEETIAHLFEPFFTTKDVGQGTGLGLSTAYGIVHEAGGAISVDSLPERGSTFEVLLPSSSEAQIPSPVSEPPRTGVVPAEGTILVVEDEASVRDIIVKTLEKAGYDVLVANGARHAIELATPSDRRIDLLLSDVVMPGIGGVELAEQLIRARPGMKRLFISGYPNRDRGRTPVFEDPDSFLSKPFTPHELVSRVAAQLEGSA